MCKEVAVIMSVHETENLVAATLERYMKMGHEGSALSTEVNKLI